MKKARGKTRFGAGGFLDDQAIRSTKSDRLGRSDFADALATRIRAWKGRESLVIALAGEWGSGKTSLKNMVLERISSRRAHSVDLLEFNPWQLSGHNSLSAVFFRELESLLLNSDPKDGDGSPEIAKKLSWLSKLTGLGAIAAQTGGQALSFTNPEWGAALQLSGAALTKIEDASKRAAEVLREPEGGCVSISALKKEISSAMSERARPVVVVIDDIDRLSEDEIREVFQLIKVNADFPNTIFLILFDRNVVATALDKISGNRGQKFLEKIVQVLLHVPQPSLSDVHKILFDAIELTLTNRPDLQSSWDRDRWRQLWLDGLIDFFPNLRSVYRFLSSFEFQCLQLDNRNTFEANFLDMFCLEALRVAEPQFYEAVSRNKDLLLGMKDTDTWEDEEQKRRIRSERIEGLVNECSDPRKTSAKAVITRLFPRMLGHSIPDDDMLVRTARVGHTIFFDRYFRLSLAGNEPSKVDLDDVFRNLSGEGSLLETLNRLEKNGRLDRTLEIIDSYRDELPLEYFPAAVTQLVNAADAISRKSVILSSKPDFSLHAWRLINFSLKRVRDESLRFDLLQKGVDESIGIRLVMLMASFNERRRDRSEYLITEEQAEVLKATALRRIREASRNGSLLAIDDASDVVWSWQRWGNVDEVRSWSAPLVGDVRNAIWILKTTMGASVSTRNNRTLAIRYLNLEHVNKISDVGLLENTTRNLDLELFAGDEKSALKAFRYALKWRDEGRDPSWHGDDLDEANPLAEFI